MTWDEFLPEVLRYAKGCPEALALDHVVKAARYFARKTRVWNLQLAAIPTIVDQPAYPLTPVAGQSIASVLTVFFDSARYVVRGGALGRANVRDGTGNVAVFDPSTSALTLTPAPGYVGSLYVDVAVQPTTDQAASSWPDWLEDEAEFIAAGAASTLALLPGVTWRDAATAAERAALFNNRIAVVAQRVSRTLIPSDKAATAVYF